MKENRFFSALLQWIHSTELAVNPSKQLPGRWKLFEYYTEPEGQLTNVKEEQIKKENQFWEIHFAQDGYLRQITNLPVQFLTEAEECNWQISRNFITWVNPENSEKKVTFQFAINGEQLKLLNKDDKGKILFFGFFKKF